MTASDAERTQFKEQGFFVRPGFLDAATVDAVSRDIDVFDKVEEKFDGRNIHRYDALSDLTVHAGLLDVASALMGGEDFVFHHEHAARHREGMPGAPWHHDYEQIPQTNRSHLQLHAFFYLQGLNGEIGDLILAPRTHKAIMRRDAMSIFAYDDLPGTVVLDNLPPGSVVFAHSALVHARRPKPGGAGRPRYFADISYMKRGIPWPSYGREGWQAMLTNLDAKVGHKRPGLFDPSAFFDIVEGAARVGRPQGSIALRLPEADASAARQKEGVIPVVQ